MSSNTFLWDKLPNEIRNEIIRLLPLSGGRCSVFATVCRDWRSIIEPLNFAEISLTAPRLADPSSQAILSLNRSYIRYIWFRVELQPYDCTRCVDADQDRWGLDNVDNQFIMDAFESLFTTLAAWEPRGDLVLDISVYSPSDTQHWFKYLSFRSDTDRGECSSSNAHDEPAPPIHDQAHGWVSGQQVTAPTEHAIEKTFAEMLCAGPFDEEEPEIQWWRSLPFVPVVGVKRSPTFSRGFLKELCFEPWREWNGMDMLTDRRNKTLIESFLGTKLRKLTIFENFNESYPEIYFRCAAIRVPTPAVSQNLARISLHLTTLSASFMADAAYFFSARREAWTWEKLTSLALTSRILIGDGDTLKINTMLQDAAAAALKMPKLDTMELWNGRRGVAMLFRYQRVRDGRSAIITVRGTFELALGAATIQAWDAVAHRHHHGTVVVQGSMIDPDEIRSHGDAIQQLGLSAQVVRPVSLRQILNEHRVRA